jgi:hypothetical protein
VEVAGRDEAPVDSLDVPAPTGDRHGGAAPTAGKLEIDPGRETHLGWNEAAAACVVNLDSLTS